ncbi:MAG: PQQ-binding-like beta-propeller repeat protein [Methanosarcinales archaeon]
MLLTALLLCALVVPAVPVWAQEEVIDQGCGDPETAGSSNIAFCSPVGQEFTPTLDNLTRVDISGNVYDDGSKVTLNVRDATMKGEILTTATQYLERNWGADWMGNPHPADTWFSFDVPDISLVPGSVYVIEVVLVEGEQWSWGNDDKNPYPGGQAIRHGSIEEDRDWFFRTYGMPPQSTPTPFLISGEVKYTSGEPVSNPNVTVTNLATGEDFTVTVDSNLYLTLTDSEHVSAGDKIRINTSDGSIFNETDHTITEAEMTDGGFEQDITLEVPVPPEPDLTISKIALKTPGYVNEENVLGVMVKNIGSGDAGSFDVSLEVDGATLGEQTVLSLPAGASTELEYTWTPTNTGGHALSATADTNNDLSRTTVIIKRTDWPQFHYDEVHSGFSSSGAPDTNETLWISDDISVIGGTSTVVADGKVFAYGGPTSPFGSGDGALYCLDEFTGAIIWNISIPAPAYGSWSSPAYHDGKVFTSTDIEAGCYNATTGEQIWVFENPTGEPSVNGGPVVADGKVIVNDWQAGHYYCLDEETGELLWTFTEEQTGDWAVGYTQGVPAYEDGKLYLTTWIYVGGNVYCVDADTGDVIWNQTTPLDTCGSPAVVDGTVYVTNYNFYGDGAIYAMDASDGTILWQQTIQRSDSTPAVAYGNVYVTGGALGFSERQTYCFDATTGDLVWETDTADAIGAWTCSVAVADGKVFVGTEGGDFFDYAGTYALDAETGDVIWSYPEGGSSPAVADGTVFTIGGGRVYAFGSSKIPVNVRIAPEILNLNASGVFTAFITLPVGYDVADIVVNTVECEGAPALSGTVSASDNGTLVVKFDREDLRDDLPTGDEVEMTVTGEQTDGTRFEGSDTVKVIAKGA